MARMLPDSFPGKTTESEKRIFEAIRDSDESSDWICLHSIGIARHERKRYAECDFLLITESGVFCLEVKGGEVDRTDGVWTIGWSNRSYTSREGPFKQSQSAMQALKKELKRTFGEQISKEVMFGWGVVFPDIPFTEEDPEWDLNVVYDSRDRAYPFSQYIKNLERFTREHERERGFSYPKYVNQAKRTELLECFRHDFRLVPLLGDLVKESQEELVRMGDAQFYVLKYALNPANPRCICPGGAGTGKTLLATEAARRYADEGKSVLFLCFNRLLADEIARAPALDPALVTVSSLYHFMREIIVSAGLGHELEMARADAGSNDEFYRKAFPEIFDTALLENEKLEHYDVLIVDEGQDILHSPIIDSIELVFKGGWSNGDWLIFFDPDLQSDVYGRLDQAVVTNLSSQGAATLPLDENFRNPMNIVAEMSKVTGIPRPKCRRKLPVRMEYLTFADDQDIEKLSILVEDLINSGVRPNDICILSALKREDSCIVRHKDRFGRDVSYFEKSLPATVAPGSLIAATISGFKGLEAEVVILTDMPEMGEDGAQWSRAIWYVGMTRCTTKLFAIVSKGVMNSISH